MHHLGCTNEPFGLSLIWIGMTVTAAARNEPAMSRKVMGNHLSSPNVAMTQPYSAIHNEPMPKANVKYAEKEASRS